MNYRLPLLLLLLFGFAGSVSAQIEPVWERVIPNHPDWFDTNTERGMAYGTVDGEARMYVASRSTTPNVIRIVDPASGADLGELSSAGVEGGYLDIFLLNDVKLSDDGVIFASNMTLNAGEAVPFRVYRWDSEDADPELVIDYSDAPNMRLGDRISVAGSASDNSLVIYAGAANVGEVVRFTTDDQGQTFSSEVVTLEGIEDTGIFPSVAAVADGSGDFYYNAGFENGGINPRLHRADGSHVATLEAIPAASNTIRHFEVGDDGYLVVNDGQVEGGKTFSFYQLSEDGTSASYSFRTPSMGDEVSTFGGGDMDVEVNEDGTFILYTLASNNGIAAYQIDPAGLFEGTLYVGEEGSAPGGADPDYASLADAFADINERVPTGPLTVYITSDLDERGNDVVLNQPELTAETPLLILPLDGVTPTVTLGATGEAGGDAENAGLGIISTGHVTIDGASGEDGSERGLTFLVDDEAATRGILIHGSSTDVSVRNTNIAAGPDVAGAAAVRIAIGDAVPEGVVIENNQIGTEDVSFFHGLALVGGQAQEVSADIRGNDIYASQRAITTFWVTDSRYEGNRIWITGQEETTSWSAGVYLVLGSDIHIAGNEILGFTTNTASRQFNGGFVMNANLGDVWIYNNMIAVPEFSNEGEATDNPFFAIGANNAAGAGAHYIYHNTVRIGGSSQEGTVAAFGWEQALTTTPQEWHFRNNIFVVEHDAENAYALHWPLEEGNEPDSDYNNLYVSGSEANVGFWRGTAFDELGSWQFATGDDANSASTAVEFVSDVDLRLTGESVGDMDLAGTPLDAVTTDIDGTERSTELPYMGAFEGSTPLPIEDTPVADLPESFELHQNYPNPFNPSTTISFTLRDPGHVTVRVYNAAGQLVRELADGYEGAGTHEVRFDAGDLASGMYLYRVQVDDHSQTKQMVLVK